MTTLRVQVQLKSEPRSAPLPEPARVARLLVLAHRLEQEVRSGETDLAGIARRYGLTRARVTQLLNLTLLAPEIQEAILTAPSIERSRDPITERSLRAIVAEPVWERQVPRWAAIAPRPRS